MHKPIALAGAIAALALTSVSTEAKIICRNGYQVVHGKELATPYCTDAYIAQVAREHGFKASAERVRNNPSFRNELCRWVGSDVRIREDCDVYDRNGRP